MMRALIAWLGSLTIATACAQTPERSADGRDSSKATLTTRAHPDTELRDSLARTYNAGTTLDSLWYSDSKDMFSRRLTVALQDVLDRSAKRQVLTVELVDALAECCGD